ncbi:MAG: Flp pilus assembly complex ATPase component TadA, partial [Pirellulales bacterium]|nr:Flp pilus assembly complex ATPase component TadA [Pirellulales bacterium]
LLPMAVELGASDVHVQPRQQTWELLMRIDGVLLPIGSLRRVGDSDPVTRLMVLAGLPTYRGGQPMEGRLQWSGHGRDDPPSLRLGVFPTVHGPRAAIRLMRRNADYDTIDSLGLSDDVTENLIDLSDQTDGAILLSGPAGSGKTTTLYAILRRIAAQTPRRSVMTIEDPVEAVIDTISQSELDVASGMTLASALRSAVRQDSEVLLVSEIRDPETAEAAMQASLTGHLVFSSLHASDVAASLRRLVQLGVPMHAIRSGVRAIVSQRLLRRLCPQCQGEQSRGEQSRGCRQCLGTRYHGRFAIAQCIRLDGSDPAGESLAEALEAGESLHLMRKGARQAGGMDLFDRVQHSIDLGMTDQSEAYRVLGPNPRTTG